MIDGVENAWLYIDYETNGWERHHMAIDDEGLIYTNTIEGGRNQVGDVIDIIVEFETDDGRTEQMKFSHEDVAKDVFRYLHEGLDAEFDTLDDDEFDDVDEKIRSGEGE